MTTNDNGAAMKKPSAQEFGRTAAMPEGEFLGYFVDVFRHVAE
jgi:hypothetical protein